MTDKATSPYLNLDARSEAQARQCRALGVAYVPPAAPTFTSASNWDGPVPPYAGHNEDLLQDAGGNPKHSTGNLAAAFLFAVLAAMLVGVGLASVIVWPDHAPVVVRR